MMKNSAVAQQAAGTGVQTSTSPTAGGRAFSPIDALRRQWRQPRHAQTVALVLAVWLVLTANWPLWTMLPRLDGYSGSVAWLVLMFAPLALAGCTLLLAFVAWPRGMKPLWMLLLVLAAVVQYFMLSYGTVIDTSMVLNVFQTNASESRALFNPRLLLQVLLVAGLPCLWLAQVPVVRDGFWRNLARTLGLMLACLALMAAVVLPAYRELAPVVRNNMTLRFVLNPVNAVLGVINVKVKPLFSHPRPFASIAAGAALGASYTQAGAASAKPPLFVLVVGETGRGDHYALNGYARDTNPELTKLGVQSWHNAWSCGTNTQASVPCMFSHLGKDAFEHRAVDYDNLLDVLQAAGLGVLWVDNQAGCKGVCERVPNDSTADRADTADGQRLCSDGECLDEMLLGGLDERVAKLPPERRQRGVVVVLHQMGSHGPAYYRRSSTESNTKVFLPECTTNALANCTQEALINVYDNSIRYNDRMLAQTIGWLKQHAVANEVGLLYLSDHGESLGEMGIYLHGLPYAIAPDAQKHIAVINWPGTLAARTRIDPQCVNGTLDTRVTHDNMYHTVLGLMDVQSPTYQRQLDMFQSCRK
ncbi:MAG: Phosphoethanolamine transferase EptA [Paracidovorax wautersii]|uniref:Phosphoethanolamine transferase EptA n=1 Tax=Paracidovorax wautersii TaxID=1177982 RepID=A0A7V8JQH0_9BURK|nr:MAG: Phosphoethanolamine transferase EptA [Paracidovorax wautersii]